MPLRAGAPAVFGRGARGSRAAALLLAVSLGACSTLPTPDHKRYDFPKDEAFYDAPKDRRYERLGLVRSRIDYPSLDVEWEEKRLCQNYFNKAVKDLVKFAHEKGGEAVIEVRSVVFLLNERFEMHPRAECSDDGEEGQVLAQGIAIRYLPDVDTRSNGVSSDLPPP